MTEPATETPATAGRGRPRPQTTIDRDNEVLTYLQSQEGGQTRKQIVAGTGKEGKEIYLSLYRLSRGGLIKRDGSTWVVVTTEAPAGE